MKIKYVFIFVLLSNFFMQGQSKDKNLLKEAKRIHQKVITIDTHDDIDVSNFTADRNYTMDLPNQVTLPKMEKGGLDVAWFIVYTGQGPLTRKGYKNASKNAMAKFNAIHRLVEEYAPDKIGLATTSKEVRELVGSGKKVAMIGVENGYSIGTDIKNVEKFYNLGARYMSLSHNGHSQLSDSNTGEIDDIWLHNGLSKLGKEVVKEMNRVGMMIDVSHPSKEAMRDMIALSKAPIIASHSSARAICNHSRNLDDEQLEWMKENGGVVQTVAFRRYVNTEKNAAYYAGLNEIYQQVGKEIGFKILSRNEISELNEKQLQKYADNFHHLKVVAKSKIDNWKKIAPPVNVSDFVDHIDYIVKKIGINHVGISSDFDGNGGVEGWNDASETLNVTLELVKRGYNEEEIAKLWGENLLRVLDEVQDVASKIKKQKT
ncbi:hypothetical protein KCTC52924_02003 [Arenibacter antarcticus]|uniref:Dipeptidase n=1 Tax=Arenibacter antarcticus TaxID=2040469 RepID=A0ABW5VGI6_9FLAO|nr:dipeptidase [Arenibacter sp. H213]MCM4168431.1 peptidase M19 [Arenibacter sp. H213]